MDKFGEFGTVKAGKVTVMSCIPFEHASPYLSFQSTCLWIAELVSSKDMLL
jgi:hypothetical protein